MEYAWCLQNRHDDEFLVVSAARCLRVTPEMAGRRLKLVVTPLDAASLQRGRPVSHHLPVFATPQMTLAVPGAFGGATDTDTLSIVKTFG